MQIQTTDEEPNPPPVLDLNILQRAALAIASGRIERWLRKRLTRADFNALRVVLAELFGRPVPPVD